MLKISPETKTEDKFHFYISENLLEYTLKQEYNKIEYTSNVEYTNYYSSNLNTGISLINFNWKRKKERKKTPGIRATWQKFMLSLNFQVTAELKMICLHKCQGWVTQACYSKRPEPTVNLSTIKKQTDLNYHIKCYM